MATQSGSGVQDLLSLRVAVGHAVLRAVLLVGLGSLQRTSEQRDEISTVFVQLTYLVGSGSGDQLVGELSLMGGVNHLCRARMLGTKPRL